MVSWIFPFKYEGRCCICCWEAFGTTLQSKVLRLNSPSYLLFLGCGGREMDKRQHKLSTKNKPTHLSVWLFLNLLMTFCSRSHNSEIPFFLPYSKFPLAICFTYGNINFHDTLSVHLTHSSSLPMSESLFSMSASPLLPWK